MKDRIMVNGVLYEAARRGQFYALREIGRSLHYTLHIFKTEDERDAFVATDPKGCTAVDEAGAKAEAQNVVEIVSHQNQRRKAWMPKVDLLTDDRTYATESVRLAESSKPRFPKLSILEPKEISSRVIGQGSEYKVVLTSGTKRPRNHRVRRLVPEKYVFVFLRNLDDSEVMRISCLVTDEMESEFGDEPLVDCTIAIDVDGNPRGIVDTYREVSYWVAENDFTRFVKGLFRNKIDLDDREATEGFLDSGLVTYAKRVLPGAAVSQRIH